MRRTIRFRITAAAVVLSGVLLLGVALVMVAVVRSQLTDNLDESINQRADTLESVLSSGLPPQMPGDEDLLVQVVDADGAIFASSGNLVGKPPITSLTPGHRTVHSVQGRTEAFRVLVRRVTSQGRPAMLIVGTNYDHVTEPVSILSRFLAIAVPCVVFALGVLTRWLTGRTLRPVERMRLDMAEITGTRLDRRVKEPATGDEIDRLARTVNATLDRLEDAIRRQQRFVADASHELRSPLTRIRSELEVDIARAQPDQPTTTQQSVLDETITLQHLVDDLLHLARSDDAPPAMRLERVDLDDIVFREARRLQERGRVTVDLRGVCAVQTMGDTDQLARATRNLVENAERHATTTVTIALTERDGRARLTVSDDGDGISVENRQLIFERFTRLDEGRTRDAGGTGLGLAIVRDIVERHTGIIEIDKVAPTQFVVELPLAPE
ncbi:MAG: ATP-binding protein [Ilumatobacteraceae bacterium]